MVKRFHYLICTVCVLLFFIQPKSYARQNTIPEPLEVGVSVAISKVTLTEMNAAKSAGISCVQVGVNEWFDKKGNFKLSGREIIEEVKRARKAAKGAGVQIYAIHMPFGKYIDLSLMNETERRRVVSLQEKVLKFCQTLKPKVILFHPSWYLSLNQREGHINQLIKSALELKGPIQDMGAIMVIENMTGPELHVTSHGVKYERPLCRTVDEMIKIMHKLPSNIYAAVDMNHILYPEKLILALGKRLRFTHVSDGDGVHERHYFPCSWKGMNDWMAIFTALEEASYAGPFMFECHYNDFKDLTACYNYMYNKFIIEKYISQKYLR